MSQRTALQAQTFRPIHPRPRTCAKRKARDSDSGCEDDFCFCSAGHGVFPSLLLRYRRCGADACVLCVLVFPFLFEHVYALCVRGDDVQILNPSPLLAFLTDPAWIFCERNHAREIYENVSRGRDTRARNHYIQCTCRSFRGRRPNAKQRVFSLSPPAIKDISAHQLARQGEKTSRTFLNTRCCCHPHMHHAARAFPLAAGDWDTYLASLDQGMRGACSLRIPVTHAFDSCFCPCPCHRLAPALDVDLCLCLCHPHVCPCGGVTSDRCRGLFSGRVYHPVAPYHPPSLFRCRRRFLYPSVCPSPCGLCRTCGVATVTLDDGGLDRHLLGLVGPGPCARGERWPSSASSEVAARSKRAVR